MKALATPETDPDLFLPRWASCLRHGRRFLHSEDYDARGECPQCRRSRQSVTHYGLSNALDAPDTGARGEGRGAREIVGAVVVLLALFGFWLMLLRSNARLDRAVDRIERASR